MKIRQLLAAAALSTGVAAADVTPASAADPDKKPTPTFSFSTLKSTTPDAAKARVEARKAQNLPFTGLYTGNANADKRIFAELYQPSGNKRFDDAVQTILSVQDAAFTTPASAAGAEFDKAWTDAVNRVLAGQSKPEEALNRAQQEATAALDKASK